MGRHIVGLGNGASRSAAATASVMRMVGTRRSRHRRDCRMLAARAAIEARSFRRLMPRCNWESGVLSEGKFHGVKAFAGYDRMLQNNLAASSTSSDKLRSGATRTVGRKEVRWSLGEVCSVSTQRRQSETATRLLGQPYCARHPRQPRPRRARAGGGGISHRRDRCSTDCATPATVTRPVEAVGRDATG